MARRCGAGESGGVRMSVGGWGGGGKEACAHGTADLIRDLTWIRQGGERKLPSRNFNTPDCGAIFPASSSSFVPSANNNVVDVVIAQL